MLHAVVKHGTNSHLHTEGHCTVELLSAISAMYVFDTNCILTCRLNSSPMSSSRKVALESFSLLELVQTPFLPPQLFQCCSSCHHVPGVQDRLPSTHWGSFSNSFRSHIAVRQRLLWCCLSQEALMVKGGWYAFWCKPIECRMLLDDKVFDLRKRWRKCWRGACICKGLIIRQGVGCKKSEPFLLHCSVFHVI